MKKFKIVPSISENFSNVYKLYKRRTYFSWELTFVSDNINELKDLAEHLKQKDIYL